MIFSLILAIQCQGADYTALPCPGPAFRKSAMLELQLIALLVIGCSHIICNDGPAEFVEHPAYRNYILETAPVE